MTKYHLMPVRRRHSCGFAVVKVEGGRQRTLTEALPYERASAYVDMLSAHARTVGHL